MDKKKNNKDVRIKNHSKDALDNHLGRPQNPPPQPKEYEEIEY